MAIFELDRLYKSTDHELRPFGTPGSLAVQRHKGIGPPFHKLGSRVFYLGKDLEKWVGERRVEPKNND